jgi:hypothetical protein
MLNSSFLAPYKYAAGCSPHFLDLIRYADQAGYGDRSCGLLRADDGPVVEHDNLLFWLFFFKRDYFSYKAIYGSSANSR